MKYTYRKILGVTLLEVMLVLAVAAMVIVMSVRYYQSAQASEQANTVLEQIQAIAAAADGIAQPTGSYSTITTSTIQPLMPNQQMSTVYGASIAVSNSSGNVVIAFESMPASVCSNLTPKIIGPKFTIVAGCLTVTYHPTA